MKLVVPHVAEGGIHLAYVMVSPRLSPLHSVLIPLGIAEFDSTPHDSLASSLLPRGATSTRSSYPISLDTVFVESVDAGIDSGSESGWNYWG